MKWLLVTTAVIELGAGVALAARPSETARLLLGSWLDAPASLAVARVTGAALVALGVACWFARHDEQSQAARGLVTAMLLYNIAVVTVLAIAGIGSGLHGIGLWPGVVLHSAMAVWCVVSLKSQHTKES